MELPHDQTPETDPLLQDLPAQRLVDASIPLEQAVEVITVEHPVTQLRPVEPFEDFKTMLHELIRGGDYDSKSTDELFQIRQDIQAVRDSLTGRYTELARLEATLQQEMTWTNGYLIDLAKAIDKKEQPN